ncbi:MAG: NHL repeat-containing protein [Planctomycetota bacterium]
MLIRSKVPMILFYFVLVTTGYSLRGTPPLKAPVDQEEARVQGRARRQYPPHVTDALLRGKIPAPKDFDRLIAERIGRNRLDELRSGRSIVHGKENDAAALVLTHLQVSSEFLRTAGPMRGEPISVEFTRSTYRIASGKTSGFFETGQDADLMLSGIDFNSTGGPLLFNHQMSIASDGTRFLVADTYNNRVLVWNKLPEGNVPPDLVLGQKDFTSNDPGTGRDQLNWPVSGAAADGHIVVADTENNRILIWNGPPQKNGEPADVVIQGGQPFEGLNVSKRRFYWPWGLWTDGKKMAITSTRGSGILIWNQFPTRDDQPADLLLTGERKLGTPRTITSNGQCLIVGDHNAKMDQAQHGSFFWRTFPTRDEQPFDFFMTDPLHKGAPWLRGCFAEDGKLVLLSGALHIWNSFPEDENDRPDLSVTGYNFRSGDHTGVVQAAGRLYVCTGNGNKVVAYNSLPTRPEQEPDFAIGAPDIHTNTLETNFIMSNPVPASNGRNLFVASDFDRKLYVWKSLPDQSGAHPDIVYNLPFGPWDIAIREDTLVLAGNRTVCLWKELPLTGKPPDIIFQDRIGPVQFLELKGVALDDHFFYVGDYQANKVYVWEGIPSEDSEPVFTLDVNSAWRLSSDGYYLAIGTFDRHKALIYAVDGLSSKTRPGTVGPWSREDGRRRQMFNGVPAVTTVNGHLFVADGFNRVHAWRRIEDALAGKWADVVLGENDFDDVKPEIGRNKLFVPAALCFDGSYLWVGETKFSERLLRFSPRSKG